MRNHSAHIADYCSASCPNPSGGTTEFMENMTFWLNSLSTAVVVIAIVVTVTTIIVTIVSIVIGLLGLKRIKASEENLAKAIKFEKQFIKQVAAQKFHNEPSSIKQPQNREEQ